MKSSEHGKNRTGMIFLLIFLGLAAGILVGGYFAYRNFEQSFRADAERQLSAIAELKANQLVEYRKERLGDALTFFGNPAFSNLVKRFFEDMNSGDTRRQLQLWIAKYQSEYSYNGMFLLDTRGITRMSVPQNSVPIASVVYDTAMALLREGNAVFQDFHRNEYDQRVYLTILVPIIDDPDSHRRLGVLLLRIDPETYLYPLIQGWPVPSRTSETLIVRREGNDVLFLNELRFQKNTALNLKISLGNEKVAAVKAVLGHEGIVDAADYRGEQVVADVRKVPDSPWFMVCRMDKSEIYEPLRSRLWMVIIVVGALLAAAGAGVGMVWRHQRNSFYREQFKSAEALRESELRFRQTFDLSPAGIVMVGLDKRFEGGNNAFARFLGCSTEELVGKSIEDVTFAEDRQLGMAEMTAMMKGEIKSSSVQKRYVRSDGQFVWGEVTISLVRDLGGRPQHFLAIIQDTTERKQAEAEVRRLFEESERSRQALLSILEDQKHVEEALRESQSLYYSFIEQLPNAVFRKDREGRYVLVNPQFCRLKGLKKEDLIGKTPMEVAGREFVTQGAEGQAIKYADVGEDVHKKILKTGQIYEAEEEYPSTDGGIQHMYVVRMPVSDSHGTIIGTQGIMFDVSERKRAEEVIQKLNADLEQRVFDRTAQLEAANKELEAFSYSVSHDLRAPLRSIDGFSQALLEDYHDKLDNNGKSYLLRVRNAAQRMGQLIDDVLDLSRIHRAEMSRVNVDLSHIANEVMEELRHAQPRNHVNVSIEPGMSAVGDPRLVMLLLQNLLENAWKFTSKHDQSRIEIGSRAIDGKKVFFVKDDGAGFDMAHADKLFAPFQRLHAQTEFPGTGIGLASVQRIVHRHGGKIWAESEVERGATFYFTL